MSRLYITPREINFISDITKEVIKDVIGQKIYYYAISENKTVTHGIYNESLEKVFDGPIIVDALVNNITQADTKIDQFGVDTKFKVEAYIQYRDLIEKGINVNVGDFFSFSDIFYEITEVNFMRNIYGLPEHKDGVRVIGTKAREGQFKTNVIGPTDISYTDDDAVQKTFHQQRGRVENAEGPTGDSRALVEKGVLEPSITGPRQVSEAGSIADNSGGHGSAFYDEDD